MPKGRLGYEKWAVTEDSPDCGYFTAQRTIDGKVETEYIHAHCLACAKADLLAEHGGRVDLRGWHKAGWCGSFLLAMANTEEE